MMKDVALSPEQLSALRAMHNSVERCMLDANGKGRYNGPQYLLLAGDYARRRLDQYFGMIEVLIAKEDA